MDERQANRAAALRRSRRECPEARQAVRDLYDRERWNNYWAREYPGYSNHKLARAANSVERGF